MVLGDRTGHGRKPEIPPATIEAIVPEPSHTVPVDQRLEPPPDSMLRAESAVGNDTVQRIWKARNMRPCQVDTFKLLNDRNFEAKLVDVIGSYLDPPDRAVGFSFDEKTQCQVVSRRTRR